MRMLSHEHIRISVSDFLTEKDPPNGEKWHDHNQDERREKVHDLFIFPPEIESRKEDVHTRKIDSLQRKPLRLPHADEKDQCKCDSDPSWKYRKDDSEDTEYEHDTCE